MTRVEPKSITSSYDSATTFARGLHPTLVVRSYSKNSSLPHLTFEELVSVCLSFTADTVLSASCYLLPPARRQLLKCPVVVHPRMSDSQSSVLVKSEHLWRTGCTLASSHPVLLRNVNVRKYPKLREQKRCRKGIIIL